MTKYSCFDIGGASSRNTHKKLTRSEAKDQGEIYYWTGHPCSKGHVDYRYTRGGQCCVCSARSSRKNTYGESNSKMSDIDRLKDEMKIQQLTSEE